MSDKLDTPGLNTRRFRPYPEYKDSGVEWLGEIPLHWESVRFGFNADFIVPMRDKPLNLTGPIPWIRIEDFEGKYLFGSKSNQGVDSSTIKEMNLKVLSEGTVLCSCSCNMGATAIVKSPLISNQTFIGIIAGSKYEPEYLYYLMQVARQHLTAVATGAIQQYLSRNEFSCLRMPLLPKDEQCAIAAFLDRETAKIDALIEKKERLIELLQEKRTALITQAVTKGLDPTVPMKDSGIEWIGKIPAHWEVKRLLHLSDPSIPIVYGILLPGPRLSDGVPYIGAGDIPDSLRLAELPLTTEEIAAQYPRSRMRAGELVYAIRGSFGAVQIVPSELDGVNLSRDAARIAPRQSIVTQWLCWALRSETSQSQFGFHELGATITGVNIRDLKRVVIPCPQNGEQRVISAFLDRETAKIDAFIANVQEATDRLKELRTALISAAVTGKIDVREA